MALNDFEIENLLRGDMPDIEDFNDDEDDQKSYYWFLLLFL